MASGFDGLVERLLYDAALAGTGGQLIDHVAYDQHKDELLIVL